MASAGTPVAKRQRENYSCSPLSTTARRLLVAKCAREGILVYTVVSYYNFSYRS